MAEEALVSRATAYRYFPGVEALLVEAALDVAVPRPRELFRGGRPTDPVARLERVDTALHDMILRQRGAAAHDAGALAAARPASGTADDCPPRQNRRTPLIEAALEPARERLQAGRR